MTLAWRFDTSGLYPVPVVVVENRYRYIRSGDTGPDGDLVTHYKCVHGCPAAVSVGTKSEERDDGWDSVVKFLYNVTPLEVHSCQQQLNSLQNLDSLLTSFHL